MNTAANPASRPSPQDLRAMNRALTWSIVIHVGVVVLLVAAPRDWFSTPPRPIMTISLGGTPGPRSTGTTSIGGRTVEQVAPPPRRPDPVPPPPRNEPDPVVTKPPPQPAAKPVPTAKPQKPVVPPVRPPTTGAQVTQGNTPADTGATGQGAGLTFGGGGTGGETNLDNFCCPEYIQLLIQQIDYHWQKAQPQRGTTRIRFTIRKDGTIGDLKIVQPSGSSLLDRVSQRALIDSRLPPLPAQYPSDELTVNLTFPYEGH